MAHLSGPVLRCAQTYPVASASASVTYVFNPATDAFERQTRVLGPIIGERAETIGEGQLDLALSSYVSLDSINDMSLSRLVTSLRSMGRSCRPGYRAASRSRTVGSRTF